MEIWKRGLAMFSGKRRIRLDEESSQYIHKCVYVYVHTPYVCTYFILVCVYTHVRTHSHTYMHKFQKIEDYVELIEQNNQGLNKLDFYFSLQENYMTYS